MSHNNLLNLDISDFNVRKPPITVGLIEQKIESFGLVEKWWYQKLRDGELSQGNGWKSISTQELYDDYVEQNKKIRAGSWLSDNSQFGRQLREMLPKGWPKKPRVSSKNGTRFHRYDFPSLKKCREYFLKRMRADSIEW